ncbi:MAG: TrmB family transcriptional regulator [Candidatus Kariarchaeaceae archaeon]
MSTYIHKSLIDSLQEVLGLTLNEARVYSILLEKHNSSPKEISEKLGLAHSRVYESLSKLTVKSLVERSTKGKGYVLIPPKESVAKLMEQEVHSFEQQKHSLNQMKNFLNDIWHKNLVLNNPVGVELIPANAAETYLLDDISNTKHQVLVAKASESSPIDWKNSGHALGRIIKKGLDVRYLVQSKVFAEKFAYMIREYSFSQTYDQLHSKNTHDLIRYNNDLHISFIIVDTISYLAFFQTETMIEPIFLRSASSELTKALLWMFNTLWDSATGIIKE